MEKIESAVASKTRGSRVRSRSAKPPENSARPGSLLALDGAEVDDTIDRIREEVGFHQACASELKARQKRLTGTAFSELLKVRELTRIIAGLKESGRAKPLGETPGPAGKETAAGRAPDSQEQWKKELDREMEKLLIVEKLLEASLPPSPENVEPSNPRPEPNGVKKILVVDDDPTTVKIISHFLEKENYLVSSSFSGVDGLKKAFEEGPDLILLDVMIPDLNGFQFLSVYRQDGENARTPVVILSSLSEETEVLKGLEIGAVDYITKPFSPQVLMAKIKKNIHCKP